MKEKGTCLYKTSCPNCNSSDGNQVYGYSSIPNDSFCYACNTFFPPDKNEVVQIKPYKADTMKDLEHIKSLPILAIKDRQIRQETASTYRVRASVSQEDGTTITHLYSPDTLEGKLVGYECKDTANKAFSSIGDRKGELDLWGSWTCSGGGNKLFVTEGRLDAMSLFQVIDDLNAEKYKAFKPSVVSLTRGSSGAVKDLLSNKELLSKFKQVVLVFDSDEAGKKATKECLKVFPLFLTAKLPLKDASAMLTEGRSKELYDACVWNSSVERQGEVVEVTDELIQQALVRPKMGLNTCWPTLDKLTYGLHPHQIIVFGSYAKAGKSEWKNQLIHHLTQHHNRPVGVYDLEVHPIKTLKQIASKLAKTNFLKPDNDYDDRLLATCLEKYKGKLFIYDRTGSRDWNDIKACIIEQHLLDGVCEFFLDPLTALISRFSSSEANDRLNEIMTDLADLVNNYPITVICFSHVNAPPKGSKSHEEGGKILSGQFTGSRALEKWSHLGLGLERDRSADCPPDQVNHSTVKILYDRDFGASGSVDMFYDTDTTEYLESIRRY